MLGLLPLQPIAIKSRKRIAIPRMRTQLGTFASNSGPITPLVRCLEEWDGRSPKVYDAAHELKKLRVEDWDGRIPKSIMPPMSRRN